MLAGYVINLTNNSDQVFSLKMSSKWIFVAVLHMSGPVFNSHVFYYIFVLMGGCRCLRSNIKSNSKQVCQYFNYY